MEKQKDTADIVTYYTVETYAVFHHIDRSILATNSFLTKFGYEFVCFSLKELEIKFSSLLSLPTEFKSEVQVLLHDRDLSISNEFYQALTNSPLFGHQVLMSREVIFLRAISDFEQKVINNTVNMGVAMQYGGKLQEFVAALIQQFRLFKNGDIDCSMQFQIRKEARYVTSKLSKPIAKSYGHTTFTLTEQEVENLSNSFNETFTGNALTELAISNFNLSYSIADIKTKYITLMTCLESLFNQGRDQIAHTVSRHLSLIISKSEAEFEDNYHRVKKLYQLRNTIVHGGTPKENLSKATDELQNLVRKAINYCLTLQLNKEKLFDKLNTFGFGKL